MKSVALTLLASAALIPFALPQKTPAAANPFEGRWDLTINTPSNNDSYPSWLEVKGDKVRVVSREASVHPIENPKFENNRLTFKSTEWFVKRIPIEWEFEAAPGHKLTGTQRRSDGVSGKITGVPSPTLKRATPTAWTKPEPIFNGKDLTGWEPYTIPGKTAQNHWKAINGELVNEAAGANLRSTRKFQDFKLHIELNCPQDGNSGVYLRGRYEMQVDYEPNGGNDAAHSMGAIYGFLAPDAAVPPTPGQWETFDVTLVGRLVTIVRNGVTIHNQKEIPAITGGALDSHEDQPGPFYIQGDHTGGMKYRNITISVPQK